MIGWAVSVLTVRCAVPASPGLPGSTPRWRQHPARRDRLLPETLPTDRDAERIDPAGAPVNLEEWWPDGVMVTTMSSTMKLLAELIWLGGGVAFAVQHSES